MNDMIKTAAVETGKFIAPLAAEAGKVALISVASTLGMLGAFAIVAATVNAVKATGDAIGQAANAAGNAVSNAVGTAVETVSQNVTNMVNKAEGIDDNVVTLPSYAA